MNKITIYDLFISYILGVVSSITASIIILFYKEDSNITKGLQIIIKWESFRRLRYLIKNNPIQIKDPHYLVRIQWANCLLDIGSKNINEVNRALYTLSIMADILDEDEKVAANDVLKLKFITNPMRNIDIQYLNTMQKLQRRINMRNTI